MASNATGNTEAKVSTLVAEQMRDPSITVLPAGGWISVWGAASEDDVEFDYTVFQRFDAAGNPVGAETLVGDPDTSYNDATVLPLSDGGWLVIHDGGDIVQQRFDAAGNAVGGESQVNTASGDLRGTKATALEDGGWVVGWNRNSFNEQVFQQVFDAQGNAVGGEVRVNTTTSGRHFVEDLEALPDGGWVVVWEQGGGINDVLQQRFDANGDPVGGETRVNTIGGGPNSNPTVTALTDGGWVVTWADPDGDQNGIFQQRYDSSGDAVGSQTGVNTTTAGFQGAPEVTALPDGGWVVVWHSGGGQDGDRSGIYMQRFDANGGAVGTETLVNVTTAGNQSEASVTALDGVGWVVTWVSTDPVTFDEEVMQRVFAADIEGTDGDDVIDGRVFDEAIFGLDGDDTINGGDGGDTIEGGEGTDNMDGGDGIDTLSYAGSTQGVTVRLDTGTASGGDAAGDTFVNFENLTGSAQNDILGGTTGANVLSGGAGNDTMIGLGGADLLIGGEGNDSFDILPTEDFAGATFDGGAGSDRLLLRTAGEGAHVYDLTEATLTSIEEIEFFADGGGFVENTKTVSLAASQVGGAGLPSTLLIDGNDSSNSMDLISIAMGDATSLDLSGWTFQQWGTRANSGHGEVIAITGDNDAETITGSSEREVIEGGGGADTMDGGTGEDTLSYAGSAAGVSVNLLTGVASGGDAEGDIFSNFENIIGSAHDDILTGDDGNNFFEGGTGADTLDGGAGIDTLNYANSSAGVNIRLFDRFASGGDAAGDTISGFENVIGSAFNDQIEGSLRSSNTLFGGDGNDTLIGQGGADFLYGGNGADVIRVNRNAQTGSTLDGGAGSDTLFVFGIAGTSDFRDVTLVSLEKLRFEVGFDNSYVAQFNAGQFDFSAVDTGSITRGAETVRAEIFMDTATTLDLSGVAFSGFKQSGDGVTINGDLDNETITGSSVNDTINGGGGNDLIKGGVGADILNGGDGIDVLSYAGSAAGVIVDLSSGAASGGDAEGDTISSFENLTGSAHDDVLTGDDGDNVIEGGAGDDTLDGGSGSDTASYAGASGAVTVDLEAGTANGAHGNDSLTSIENVIGGEGNDVISDQVQLEISNIMDGGEGDDRLVKNSGTIGTQVGDTWIGGSGTDTFEFRGLQGDGHVVDLSLGTLSFEGEMRDTLTGSENVEVHGSAGIIGDDQDNILTAIGDFENVISGGDGADIITGGGGDDTLTGDQGDDRFIWNEGDGSDTINGGAGTDTVEVNLSDGATGDVVTLSGSSGNNVERTDFDPFTLSTEGVERFEINGQGGDDEIDASNARSFVTLDGGDGNDILRGGIFNSTIRGGAGADQMFGGGGTANMLDYSGSSAAVEVDLATGLAAGGDAEGDTFDNKFFGIIGSDHDDVLRGRLTNVKEQLFGGGGNDTLVGGDGEDQLFGGDGDDLLIDGGRGDLLDGGDGIDTMSVENKTTSMTIDLAAGTATNGTTIVNVENVIGTTNADVITGNDVANVLEGRGGDDTLDGGAGADRLIGGTGNDTYHVDNTADTIVELFDEGNDTVISSVNYALRDHSQNLETLTLTGTALFGTGNGLANTITGNAENNTLNGAFGDDTLIGGAGDDTFLDDDGADRMVGGLGDDTYHVDNAGDTIEELFDQGNDTVISSISFSLRDQSQSLENLTLTGTARFATGNGLANTITGNAGNNTLNGAFGDDTLIGGAGNDTFLDDDGADRMVGGLGDDTYFVDNVGDKTIEAAGEGTDTVNSSVDYFLWNQSQHIENLTLTGSGDINAGGNALANVITGNSGNNDLNGGANADRMVGGLGNDTYHVDNIGDKAIELADGGTDTVVSSISFELWQQNQFLENLTLVGTGNLNGTGNALANTITGNDGNNALNGGLGADRMVGGKGNDTYRVDNIGDTTIELAGEGTDTVNSSVNYFLWNQSQHIENLTLIGTANLNAGGNTLANTITGNAGNNELNGGANADRMIGGLGDDTYHVDNTGDKTIELAGEGTDTVNSSVNYFLWDQSQHIENLTLTGTANINAGGNALANTITGNSGNNDLNGGANADRMIGGLGNDTYHVDNTGDTIVELFDEGNDTVISSVDYALRDQSQNLENLTLTGTAVSGTGNGLANTITGNAGNNTLNGAFGNDRLIGGAGNDTFRDDAGNDIFTGGAGADTFFFLGAGESDRITDFEDGIDTITIGLGVNSFADITVTDSGADTLLSFGSNTVTLENFDHTLVTSDDFSFV